MWTCRRTLLQQIIILMLTCNIANASDFAVRNKSGGLIVITDSPCELLQVRALYIDAKISLNQAYTTDKEDKTVANGCWIVDSRDDEVTIVWEDWSMVAMSSAGWVELDDLATE